MTMTTPAPPAGPTSSDQPLLSLRGVTKSFGAVEVLREVDLDVRLGRVTALVGDNGAGKSTLIKGDGSDKTTADQSINNQKVTIGAAYAVPVWITKANIKVPFDAGYTTAAKVCTGTYASLCTAAGIS